MNTEHTNSITVERHSDPGPNTKGSWYVISPLASITALVLCFATVDDASSEHPINNEIHQVSNAMGGTTRIAMPPADRYKPKTELGRKLVALRQAAIAKGMPLVPAADIISGLEESRR